MTTTGRKDGFFETWRSIFVLLLIFPPVNSVYLGASKGVPHLERSAITSMNASGGRGNLGLDPQAWASTARANITVGDRFFSIYSDGVGVECDITSVTKGKDLSIGFVRVLDDVTSHPMRFSSLSTIRSNKTGSGSKFSGVGSLNQIVTLPWGRIFARESNCLESTVRPNTLLLSCLSRANCASDAFSSASAVLRCSLANSVSRFSISNLAFARSRPNWRFPDCANCAKWLAFPAFCSAMESTSDSCDLMSESEFEARTSNTVSLTIPPTTKTSPNAAMGYRQLPGLSGMDCSFFLCLRQFVRSTATSQISSPHPTATTIPEIQTPRNHLALSDSSAILTGSGDVVMKERNREARWFLIFLSCWGFVVLCGVVYIFKSRNVP
jgi:hypothetical protein